MTSSNVKTKVTLKTLTEIKANRQRFACVTAYDSTFAEIASSAGIEVLLVGDSLGMVLQGHDSTLPVTMENIVYHLEGVRRGNAGSLIMGDMPFMTYYSEGLTLHNAAQLMRAGAHIVKLEGGRWIAESTRLLVERGIPVCAHMGLTPQSINRFGGFRVQGRDPSRHKPLSMRPSISSRPGPACYCWRQYPSNSPSASRRNCAFRSSESERESTSMVRSW